ncbi:Mitochondrial import inner membrane translocase subunit Tim54 [Penicillium griseofulvum]|uniref:Mitochondrial import inner membrane translocase subunit TIM54 n=1 Tax=Penicillium patulum TaxID=5078 RepID=A0A135LP78_PENPA|nr:Mitochondrial import inner membrane translocase subunit Tim54 [Penicillium griseofulvum]KXG50766.1 Mitochondrial import inner membrane translocase subunit Tim54 [Penicillium griseofulvum]
MADSTSSAAPSGASKPQAAPKPPNPVFKMMGLPNMRFKLPSRNWMIFLTITGSFTGAIMYDRREKRRVQQKWSELVAHISKETLPVDQMRRKMTVYLAAPPGDGLRVARDHFKEYVKPILVAAALDYTVIEGRREGDVRAGTAENIRKQRRKAGEPSSTVEEVGVEAVIAATREHIGVTDEPSPKGDLVIGRHTWKEYIRGLHEGWLGPLDAPPPPPEEVKELAADTVEDVSADKPVSLASPEIASIDSPEFSEENKEAIPEPKIEEPEKEEEKEEEKKPSKPAGPTPAYIYPSEYSSAILPHTIPQSFDSSAPVEFPHILGFLNTPIRVYRFLTQRHLAEDVGRQVAAVVLANSARPYREDTPTDSEPTAASVEPNPSLDTSFTDLPPRNYEQQTVMQAAESEWHKSVHKHEEDEKEREWLDDIVLDQRIASRMQRATLSPEDEARAQRIGEKQEYILGEERPTPVPFWKRMWIDYGYGESEEALRRKPILGNIDEDVQ